jgi:hypothetical protein
MKKLVLLFSIIFLFNGCSIFNDQITNSHFIEKKCAKFPVEEFKAVEDYNITGVSVNNLVPVYNEEGEKSLYDIKDSGDKYVIMRYDNFVDFVKQYKKS